MIELPKLLPMWAQQLPTTLISGLKLDSRRVAGGDCFIAIAGHEADGRAFVADAIAAGAAAVLQHGDEFAVEFVQQTPVVTTPQLAENLSAIAARFYQQPDAKLRLFGVTGTNGKTTVTHLLAQLWQQLGQPSAVLGTLGSGFIQNLLPEQNTTPDALTVQQRLAGFAAEGAQTVAMEVSSHALVQHRVESLAFDTVIATNLSRDHLDYHGSMAAYAAAKQRLFTEFQSRIQILNADDAVVADWAKTLASPYFFSMQAERIGQPQTLVATDINYHGQGADFVVHWQEQSESVSTMLLGDFNIANVLAAMLSPLANGHSLSSVAALASQLRPVAGRMETFTGTNLPLVIVDYAHTPAALEQVLTAARRHCHGDLWCVFGCGGDRDRGKRPQMGAVASQFADRVVVTDDNPRTEDSLQIIADIVSGLKANARVWQLPGREGAVRETIANAGVNDVVVLAGKGHEDYQIVGQQRLDYNERAIVAAVMKEQCA